MNKPEDTSVVEQPEATPEETSADEQIRQAQEYLAGWQRAKADYINLKRDSEEKLAGVGRYIKGDILAGFLPIYQHLLTAYSHLPPPEKDRDWAVGLGHVLKQVDEWLESNGVERMQVVGEQFDHERHEAVETATDESKADNEILNELSPGYTLDKTVLIHPKVKVNSLATDEQS